MYENYFGLTRKPFDLNPDPTIIFNNEMHKEALAILRYGIADRKSFLLLTGNVGTGKTTLLQVLLHSIGDKNHVCLISNPKLSIEDFYEHLATTFELEKFTGHKTKFLLTFTNFLKECHSRDERVILIIDEAQVLPIDILEEIRLLSNQEYLEYGVMSIFLVGQPELNKRLSHERLLPLRQRISIRFHLEPFSAENTEKYILYRLEKSGLQQNNIFTQNAIKLIHDHTGGVPRLINNLCDQAMLFGFAESTRTLNTKIVTQAINSLQIPGEPASPLTDQNTTKPGITGTLFKILTTISLILILIGFGYLITTHLN